MSGYVISNYTVNDQEKYEKYLIRDDDAKAKGCPHKRLVLIEFESEEAAWRWYKSPEYSAIKHYREEASEGWGAIVSGCVTTKD